MMPPRAMCERRIRRRISGLVRRIGIGICALGIALAAWSAPDLAADPPLVSVAMLSKTADAWPIHVANKYGFFVDAGIRVDLITAGSSAQAAQETAAGSVNIGNSSTFDAMRAIDGGAPVTIFLDSEQTATTKLIAAASIKSVADLKGKRVITGGPADITNLWWGAIARHFGVDPEKDVDVIYSGASPGRFAALSSGAVDAAVLSPPMLFAALRQGYTDLGLVGPYLGDVPSNVWYVNNEWFKQHRDAVVAFARGNNRAVRWLNDQANREAAAAILAQETGIDVEVALQTYDLFIGQAHSLLPDGDIPISGLEKAREILSKAGDLKTPLKPISAFYNNEIIEAARKSGN